MINSISLLLKRRYTKEFLTGMKEFHPDRSTMEAVIWNTVQRMNSDLPHEKLSKTDVLDVLGPVITEVYSE